MIIYIIPLIVFIITAVLMYFISKDEDKNSGKNVLLKNVLPASVIGLFVFTVLKFKDIQAFNPEPMMAGNYFD